MFQKGKPNTLTVSEMIDGREAWSKQVKSSSVRAPAYIIAVGFFKDMEAGALLSRIESVAKPLSSFCTVSTGLKAYQTGKGKPAQTDVEKNGRVFHARTKLNATYGKYLDGVNVSRYILSWSGEFLSYGDWLAEPRTSVPFSGDRLLIRQIPAQPPYLVHGVFTAEPFYNDINSMVVFSPNGQVSLKYLLGLINSRLLSLWFLKRYDKLQRKIFPQFKVKELGQFPIVGVDFTKLPEKERHDRMVRLVDRMIEMTEKQTAARTERDKSYYDGACATLNRQIDALVYEIYNLSKAEISKVEKATLPDQSAVAKVRSPDQ